MARIVALVGRDRGEDAKDGHALRREAVVVRNPVSEEELNDIKLIKGEKSEKEGHERRKVKDRKSRLT